METITKHQPGLEPVDEARLSEQTAKLDSWVQELMDWHFSSETGCSFWLERMNQLGWDPRQEVKQFADLRRFGLFEEDWLRATPLEKWVPHAYENQPFHVFESGGTTGQPKQRIDWNDYKYDYEQFSQTLDPEAFPIGGHWLMVGPTGPRRLRLAIEHLANFRGGACFHVDLDPRWVKKLLHKGQSEIAKQYMDHVLDQALTILGRHPISILFATPRLLEALSERLSISEAGIKGVMCGGTSISPQVHRFLVEELLEGVIFLPVYGNTLMGLAASKPLAPEDKYAITYYPPQPRAALQVVDPDTLELVPYDNVGRVMLTTLTKEFFLPNFLERDEALRAEPVALYPWDGVRDVRPFGGMEKKVVEGVY